MRQAPRSPLSFKLQRVANVPEHPPTVDVMRSDRQSPALTNNWCSATGESPPRDTPKCQLLWSMLQAEAAQARRLITLSRSSPCRIERPDRELASRQRPSFIPVHG